MKHRQVLQGSPSSTQGWSVQIEFLRGCRRGLSKGRGRSIQDGQRSGIPCSSSLVHQRRQFRLIGNPMARADHKGFEVGGAVTAERIPQPLAQGPISSTAIGHLHAQLKRLLADVKRRSRAIEPPAPATAAVLAAVGVPSHHDHSRAADQHDARLIRKGSPQGGAFVTGCQTTIFRQLQFCSQKCTPSRL